MVDQATARRWALIAAILGRFPAAQQPEVASALREFAAAAGEIPGSQWQAVTEEALPAVAARMKQWAARVSTKERS